MMRLATVQVNFTKRALLHYALMADKQGAFYSDFKPHRSILAGSNTK